MAFLREYSLPIVIALLIHAVIVYILSVGVSKQAKLPDVAPPKFVVAKTVKLKQEAPKVAKPVVEQKSKPLLEQQRKAQEAKQAQERQRQLEKQRQEKAKQEKAKQEKAKQEKAAQEKRRVAMEKERAEKQKQEQKQREDQEKKEREVREQTLAQAAREDMLLTQMQEEMAREQMLTESEQEAQSYIAVIQQAVVVNWSRPASARNGMEVVLIVQLIPNGTVIDVRVDISSGNDAFDRSAIAAVKKAERFPELAQMKSVTFERYFRQFTMRFNPDDLRL